MVLGTEKFFTGDHTVVENFLTVLMGKILDGKIEEFSFRSATRLSQ
jgi:hypothetical protein